MEARDSHFQTKCGSIFQIINIIENADHEVTLLCTELLPVGSLYDYPCNSSECGAFICKRTLPFVKVALDEVDRKCILIQCNETKELILTILKHDLIL